MKLRNLLTGEIVDAEYTTDNPASSYGQAVLVNTASGEPMDRFGFEELAEAEQDEKGGEK